MERWYVVQTQPNRERTAQLNLDRQGYEVMLPQFYKMRRHARRTERVLRPFFPGYLFVKLDPNLTPWRAINSSIGVARLVTFSDSLPSPVPEGVVELFQYSQDEYGAVTHNALSGIRKGASLRISNGAFAGLEAVFEAQTDTKRVIVFLEILGRSTRIETSRDDVEVLA